MKVHTIIICKTNRPMRLNNPQFSFNKYYMREFGGIKENPKTTKYLHNHCEHISIQMPINIVICSHMYSLAPRTQRHPPYHSTQHYYSVHCRYRVICCACVRIRVSGCFFFDQCADYAFITFNGAYLFSLNCACMNDGRLFSCSMSSGNVFMVSRLNPVDSAV